MPELKLYAKDMSEEQLQIVIGLRAKQLYEERQGKWSPQELATPALIDAASNADWFNAKVEILRSQEPVYCPFRIVETGVDFAKASPQMQRHFISLAARQKHLNRKEGEQTDYRLEAEQTILDCETPVCSRRTIKFVEINVSWLSREQQHAAKSYLAEEIYLDRTRRMDLAKAKKSLAEKGKPIPTVRELFAEAEIFLKRRLLKERATAKGLAFKKDKIAKSWGREEETRTTDDVIQETRMHAQDRDWYTAENRLKENPVVLVPCFVLGRLGL